MPPVSLLHVLSWDLNANIAHRGRFKEGFGHVIDHYDLGALGLIGSDRGSLVDEVPQRLERGEVREGGARTARPSVQY